MKKLNVFFMMFFLLSSGFVLADSTYYEEDYSLVTETDSTYVMITKLRYESYPVSPGDYFTLYVQAKKTGSEKVDATFEFLNTYPFSLDSNEETVRSFDYLNNEAIVLEYKVRVDDSAVSGENTLEIRQTTPSDATLIHEFDIIVEDVQTSFDAVLQDSSNGEVSIALANVGQNDAGAVIVRIPEQDGVRVSGTDGQMIGNLEQGDYTVVGFSVAGTSSVLEMQVDYTDYIGVRRNEILEVSLGGSEASLESVGGEVAVGEKMRPGMEAEDSGSSYSWVIWVFVFVVICYFGYEHVKKKRNLRGKSSGIPQWMKKAKGAKK